MRPSSSGSSPASPATPTSAVTCCNPPIAPHQSRYERRPQAGPDPGQPEAARCPRVAGADQVFLAGRAVEGVGGPVARMVDADGSAAGIEREVGADRGPQPARFFAGPPN